MDLLGARCRVAEGIADGILSFSTAMSHGLDGLSLSGGRPSVYLLSRPNMFESRMPRHIMGICL